MGKVLLVLWVVSLSVTGAVATACSDGTAQGQQRSTDLNGWFTGVAMCVASAVCSVLGVTFQKRAHMGNKERKKSYLRLPIWWLGILCVISGAVLDFLSLGFAPQTVVASLGSLTLVMNAIVAPCALGESLTRQEIFGTMTITFGAVVSVGASSKTSQSYNLDELMCLYSKPSFIAYACVLGPWLCCLYAMFRVAERKALDVETYRNSIWAKLHPVSISALSGTLGANSLLFAKSVSIILRGVYSPSENSDGVAAFSRPVPYLLIGAMLAIILMQTHTLNMSLQRFDCVVVLPLFQVFWILFGIISAGAYFQEFATMSTLSCILFPVGVVVIAVGICILSGRFIHIDPSKDANQNAAMKHLPMDTACIGDVENTIASARPFGRPGVLSHPLPRRSHSAHEPSDSPTIFAPKLLLANPLMIAERHLLHANHEPNNGMTRQRSYHAPFGRQDQLFPNPPQNAHATSAQPIALYPTSHPTLNQIETMTTTDLSPIEAGVLSIQIYE